MNGRGTAYRNIKKKKKKCLLIMYYRRGNLPRESGYGETYMVVFTNSQK